MAERNRQSGLPNDRARGPQAEAVVSAVERCTTPWDFFWSHDLWFAAALVVAVFLAYQPAWRGGFLWDDDTHLLNNPVLKPGGLTQIWTPGGYVNFWPLTFTAYWLEVQLWGLKPLGFHLVNLALHALSALLVWQVLVRLRAPGAMLAAALFALHPVNVESVAWIAQLKTLLSLTLALVSVLFYLGYERHGDRWRYALAVAAFLLSALAKGTALTLPIVLLACAWWQRGRIQKRDLLRVLPYILIGAVMAGIEVWIQHSVTGTEIVRSDGIFGRAAVAGCALWFYFGKLLWPLDLCPFYPRWTINERSMLSYLPGLLWVAMLVWAWRQRSAWGGPVVMLIVCYTALLLPVLGFVNIYFMRFSLVADHWQYLATIVPCAVLAGITATLARRHWSRPAALATSLAVLAVLAVLSWRQSRMYADEATFYRTTLERNPACWMAHNNLGNALFGQGLVDAAIVQYRKALQFNPDYAEAHYNLANILAGRGQVDAAMAHYRKALALKSDYAAAHYNLGLALAGRGQFREAIAHYEQALESKPDDAKAHNNLGNALFSQRLVDVAIAHYQKALELEPDNAEAHNNLGRALAGRGQAAEAIGHYQQALKIKPDFAVAHYNLANTLAGRSQADAAIEQYQQALRLKPDYVEARNKLGVALIGRGRIAEGIAQFRKVLEIKPDDAEAQKNLATVLAGRGTGR